MRRFTMTQLTQKIGAVMAIAERESVVLTRHGRPRYVMILATEFEKLQDLSREPRREADLGTPGVRQVMR